MNFNEEQKKSIRQYVLEKRGFSDDDEQMQKLQGDQQRQNMVATMGELASDLATSKARSYDGRDNNSAFFDAIKQGAADKVEGEKKSRRQMVEDYVRFKNEDRAGAADERAGSAEARNQATFDRNKSMWQQEDEEKKQAEDPDSLRSQMARDAAKKLMPGKDWSQFSGAQIERVLPRIKDMYSMDLDAEKNKSKALQDQLDRQDKTNDKESQLRKEFEGNPVVRDFRKRKAATDAIVGNPGKSAPEQMAMVFSFMKALDPGSTVREGEYASVENTRGVPDNIRNMYNKALEGTGLTAEQVTQIKAAAQDQFDTYKQNSYTPFANRYRTYAEEYGYNPDRIVSEVEGRSLDSFDDADPTMFGGEKKPGPHGNQVEQDGVLYIWNGSEYVEKGQ